MLKYSMLLSPAGQGEIWKQKSNETVTVVLNSLSILAFSLGNILKPELLIRIGSANEERFKGYKHCCSVLEKTCGWKWKAFETKHFLSFSHERNILQREEMEEEKIKRLPVGQHLKGSWNKAQKREAELKVTDGKMYWL